MFNYNREGFLSSHEAAVKEYEAAKRQVPRHMRKNSFADARGWLANKVLWPAVDASARAVGVAGSYGHLYWRRASSRALGLVFNGFAQVREFLPGRPSMA